jgi:hypothetical protein
MPYENGIGFATGLISISLGEKDLKQSRHNAQNT